MENHNSIKQTYGLMTTIAMIVGVVIGSGIYFKVDDILKFTGGDVFLGMVILVLGSFSIVFGSLSISELAIRTSESGGIFSYYEKYVSPALAATLGLFASFLYLPTLTAIVSWVAAFYTLGESSSLESQIILAAVYILALSLMNIFAKRIAGGFQSLTTFVKMIPLVLIALIGAFWSDKAPQLPQHLTAIQPSNIGWSWVSGLVPLYFAYDGWTIFVSIAPEVKNPKKNLPLAFVIGPALILLSYLAFFYGLTQILGASFIMTTGNDAINYAANIIFGPSVGRLLSFIVILSVLGVANGLLLGTMRLPQAFAERGWIKSERMANINLKYQMSLPASLTVTAVAIFWLFVHFMVTKFNLLPGSDISEIAVVFNNTSLIILYVLVLSLYLKKDIKNKFTGLVSPILAILGGLILFIGSLLSNFFTVLIFQCFCLLFCLICHYIYQKNNPKTHE
ncbi:TPA: APC family permease [Streptococcus agalactiae]